MEFLQENAEYREIAAAAKKFGIPYVGVEKGKLRDKVNEMIAKVNNGEVENPDTESLENNNQDQKDSDTTQSSGENENAENDKTENDGESKAAEAAKQAAERARRERTARSSSKKWYEEEGAFPYKAGDVVEIIGGKDLIGRKLQVFEPSAKKDMVKGKLVHPITGNLQNTMISIAFERIQLLENNNSQEEDQTEENPTTNEQVDQIENPVQEAGLEEAENQTQEDQTEEVTNEEEVAEDADEKSIVDGSEEELNIPELETEKSEDLKAE